MRCIKGYRLLGLLGRGGMGRVYKVSDPEENLFALKLLKPDDTLVQMLGPEKIQKRFDDEIRIMSRLKHDNIARIVDSGQHRRHSFMLLEYLCLNLGLIMGTVSDSPQPSRILSPLRALDIAAQVLDALVHLHAHQIIHRDVKPENIMLTRAGRVRLIDFGLFRIKGLAESNPPGLAIGSPYYAAPEQIEDPDQADERADLYSLGVVLHRMIFGVFPGQPTNQPSDKSVFGPGWDEFLERAANPEPDLRFQNAGSMLDQLKVLAKAWEKRRDQICIMHDPKSSQLSVQTLNVRSCPVQTGKDDLHPFPGLDSLMQARSFVLNDFQKQQHGYFDLSTGLTWALELSRKRLSFDEAKKYPDQMNRDPVSERENILWRLPTVDELLTLLRPRKSLEDYCYPLVWKLQNRAWLWSADAQTRFKSWIVDMEQGAVMAVDRMCKFSVLAVAGVEQVNRS